MPDALVEQRSGVNNPTTTDGEIVMANSTRTVPDRERLDYKLIRPEWSRRATEVFVETDLARATKALGGGSPANHLAREIETWFRDRTVMAPHLQAAGVDHVNPAPEVLDAVTMAWHHGHGHGYNRGEAIALGKLADARDGDLLRNWPRIACDTVPAVIIDHCRMSARYNDKVWLNRVGVLHHLATVLGTTYERICEVEAAVVPDLDEVGLRLAFGDDLETRDFFYHPTSAAEISQHIAAAVTADRQSS